MKTETIKAALANLDKTTALCDLPDSEFITGGAITNACREAGYDESGRATINQLNVWSCNVGELEAMLCEQEERVISRITIRYNGNDITADGTHQNAGTINPTEAIEKANAWAASDKGHVDFVGGQYDVWADYEDGDSEHIHSTNIIA